MEYTYYVAILFGRSRATEDVDFFIQPMSMHKFEEFFRCLEKEYWFLNSSDIDELFSMLSDNLSIRVAEKNDVIPNYELKFALRQHEIESLQLSEAKNLKVYEEMLENGIEF